MSSQPNISSLCSSSCPPNSRPLDWRCHLLSCSRTSPRTYLKICVPLRQRNFDALPGTGGQSTFPCVISSHLPLASSRHSSPGENPVLGYSLDPPPTATMLPQLLTAAWLPLFLGRVAGQNFTVSNGQIYTPGFAIVDSPQPGTPLGGGTLSCLAPPPSNQTRQALRNFGSRHSTLN